MGRLISGGGNVFIIESYSALVRERGGGCGKKDRALFGYLCASYWVSMHNILESLEEKKIFYFKFFFFFFSKQGHLWTFVCETETGEARDNETNNAVEVEVRIQCNCKCIYSLVVASLQSKTEQSPWSTGFPFLLQQQTNNLKLESLT